MIKLIVKLDAVDCARGGREFGGACGQSLGLKFRKAGAAGRSRLLRGGRGREARGSKRAGCGVGRKPPGATGFGRADAGR